MKVSLTCSGLVLNDNLRSLAHAMIAERYPASKSASIFDGNLKEDPFLRDAHSTLSNIPLFAFGYPKIIPGETHTLAQLLVEVIKKDINVIETIEVKQAPVSQKR